MSISSLDDGILIDVNDGYVNIHSASGAELDSLMPGASSNNINGLIFDGDYMWVNNWDTAHVYKMNTGEMLETYTVVPEIQTVGLGPTDSSIPTAYSFQRKTWYDGSRHWLAYYVSYLWRKYFIKLLPHQVKLCKLTHKGIDNLNH